MRAAVLRAPGQPLVVEDVELDEPGPGEVRVRIEAAGVNRLDQLLRSGAYPRPFRLPHARLGCEGSGVVDAIGHGVAGLHIGDPVIITALPAMDVNGTYADYTVVPASEVIPRPATVDAAGAAALWVAWSTAYGALVEKAGLRPGDRVLVTAAAGSVGLAAIQVANSLGAVPIAVTRSSRTRDRLLAAGASHVVATDSDDLVEAVRARTGAGVDVILDTVMGPGLAELATAARPGGTVVTAGWLDPRPASMPMSAPLTIHRYMSFEHTLDPVVVRRMAAALDAGLRAGVVSPVVDAVFDLDDVVAAHRRLDEGHRVGKIVITT
jgi:NADPH:quinone reductase